MSDRYIVARVVTDEWDGIHLASHEPLVDLPTADDIHLHRNPDGTWTAVPMDLVADIEDEGSCPYYRFNYCGDETIAREVAVCAFGCSDEPVCVTCVPDGGWPSTRVLWVDASEETA